MTALGWSILLVLLSGIGLLAILLRWGVQSIVKEEGVTERFLRNQRRRRRMIMWLGVLSLLGMILGAQISSNDFPELFIASWLWVVFLLCWIMILGFFDFLAIRTYYKSEESRSRTEEAILRYHLRTELKRSEEQDREQE